MYFVRIYRRLTYLTGRGFALLSMYMSVLVALLRIRRNFVVRRYAGQRSLEGATKVAALIHYDSKGKIYDFLVYYLEALRGAGFEIVFTSNAPKLDPDGLARILPLCALVLHRKNIGYDFGAYKDSLAELGDLSRFDEVILANDSVYGPLFDLKEVLAKCDGSADVWGMTDGWDRCYHLQSYFLLFKNSALKNLQLQKFWRFLRPVTSKDWVIQRYETGLTQSMLRGGLTCAALFPYRQAAFCFIEPVMRNNMLTKKNLRNEHRHFLAVVVGAIEGGGPLNVMHHLWEQLVQIGCPFIKRELLMKNPVGVPTIYRWEEIVKTSSNYDTGLIVRHLQATLHGRVI